jgi:hypothetical protein
MKVSSSGRWLDDEGAAVMETTTTFIKPKFVISALPGTGELQVQVKASAEKPAPRAALQVPVTALS